MAFDWDPEWEEEDPDDRTPPVKVWVPPERDHVYTVGVDTAEGLGHGDNACLQVLDTVSGEQCAVYCGRLPPDLLGSVAGRLGWAYNGALLVVEANNHGLVTISILRRLGYKSLFRRRVTNRVFNRVTEEFGFKTTRTTKPTIINGLDEGLRNGELVIHEAETITECIGYVRDERGVMGGSPFDDRVMALALAHYGRQFLHLREPERPKRDEYGTGKWWRSLLSQDSGLEGKMVVGRHIRRRGSPV